MAGGRAQLIEQHLDLVTRLARRHAGRGEPLEDLKQVASVALIHAVDRFDPARGVPLRAYATAVITGELQRHLRDRAAVVRIPRRARDEHDGALSTARAPLPVPPDHPSGADPLAAAGVRLDLSCALARLGARERRAVALRYFADLPRAEVARRLGLSEGHTARVLHDALAQLAGTLTDHPL